MIVNERLESVYRQVELVRGAGDPKSGKLCVMSFVAFLAGEVHTDRPAAASPLIRDFAVRINDAMPNEMRQELKPFVPRILGTNDHLDGARAGMLRAVTEAEIMPKICRDFVMSGDRGSWRKTGRFWELSEKLFSDTNSANPHAENLPPATFGAAVADLLCYCAVNATRRDSQRWYWEKAIDVLDRACDFREEANAASSINEERVRRLEMILANRALNRRIVGNVRNAFECFRVFLARTP